MQGVRLKRFFVDMSGISVYQDLLSENLLKLVQVIDTTRYEILQSFKATSTLLTEI